MGRLGHHSPVRSGTCRATINKYEFEFNVVFFSVLKTLLISKPPRQMDGSSRDLIQVLWASGVSVGAARRLPAGLRSELHPAARPLWTNTHLRIPAEPPESSL